MASPTREDTYLINVIVAGRNLGTFDTWDGGEVDSEEAKYRPGGMEAEISLGGRRSIGNVTVDRYYDIFRDHAIYKWLAGIVGQAVMTASWTPLTPAGVAAGAPVVYTGTLKQVTPPSIDSMGSDVAKLALEMTCNGSVA